MTLFDGKPVDVAVVARDATPPDCSDEKPGVVRSRDNVAVFALGLVVTHGGMDVDPACEYVTARPGLDPHMHPRYVDWPTLLFPELSVCLMGGVAVDWRRRLHVVPRDVAVDFIGFMSSLQLVDRQRQHFAMVSAGEVRLQFVEGSLAITVFGVGTPSCTVDAVAAGAYATLRYGPPDAHVCRCAAIVLGQHPTELKRGML